MENVRLEGNGKYGDWRMWPWVWRREGVERERMWLQLVRDWMEVYAVQVPAAKDGGDVVVRGGRYKVFERKVRVVGQILREAKEGGLKVRVGWGDWNDGLSRRRFPRVEVWLDGMGILVWFVGERPEEGLYWWGVEHKGGEGGDGKVENPVLGGKDGRAVVIPGWEDAKGPEGEGMGG